MDRGRWTTGRACYGPSTPVVTSETNNWLLLHLAYFASLVGETVTVVVSAVLRDILADMARFAPDMTDSYGRQVSVIMRLQQLMLEDAQDFEDFL